MLAPGARWVEGSSQRQIEGDKVLVGADDPQEIQSKFSEIQVLD